MGGCCCKPRKIDSRWLTQSEDTIDGEIDVELQSQEVQTERRISATQLLCQTCLYWLIRYFIQNSDLILKSLFPKIHDQVDGPQKTERK
ncbi:U exon [Skua adenovirus 1]|uniref:U exon n=1 Tax=South Polar skua adenovirus 1 TaxID=2848087 RepID=G9B6L4_9ADEN|nr:U exon [Skua adenovirus 1]ADP30830.1 U exon [Skua adenovirus 1]